MKKKIAYILKMYPRFSETFIVNEILELERQGVDVRIYSLRKPDDGRFHARLARVRANVIYAPQYPQLEPERIRTAHKALKEAFPERYARTRAYTAAKGHSYAIKRFLQAGYIAAHLLHHPVDAIHAHFATSATRVSNLVYRLCGTPYSFTAHAKDIFHESVSPDSLRAKMRDARFVITVSRYNQQYLQAMMNGETADIRCLYNGIDLTRFRPDYSVPRQPNLILGIGRLVEKKGFDVLIRACALLAERGVDFQCEIIGKGGQREALKALIQELGLQEQVRLLGPRPQDQVLVAYQEAALFALPCVVGNDGNRDGLPTVLLEAMATGMPVISTDLTGIPEIIDHDVNGLIVPQGDAVALADALEDLLGDPVRRERMGIAARFKVEQSFDVLKSVTRLHQWLAEPITAMPLDPLPEETIVPRTVPFSPLPTFTLEEVFETL